MAVPAAYGSSQARDWIRATDPLTHCTRQGIKEFQYTTDKNVTISDTWRVLTNQQQNQKTEITSHKGEM